MLEVLLEHLLSTYYAWQSELCGPCVRDLSDGGRQVSEQRVMTQCDK